MSENKIIAATVEVNTGQATANIKSFATEVKSADKEIAKIGDTSKKTAGDANAATGSFGKLKEGIGGLPGPLGAAEGGVKSLSVAFKALLANPVGLILTAIVAVLTLLYKSFTNTFEGANKVEQVFAGIKATATSLFENLDKIGSALSKLFTFDFSGAKKELEAVIDTASKAGAKAAEITERLQKLKVEQRQNDLEQVDRAAEIADLKEKATDSDVKLVDRLKAALVLQEKSKKNQKEDIALAKRDAEDRIAILSLSKNEEKKNAEEINQIKIKQRQVEQDGSKELRTINKLVNSAEKEQAAEIAAARKEAAEKAKAERQKLAEFNKQLRSLEQANDIAATKEGYDRELLQLKQRGQNQKDEIAQQLKDGAISKRQANKLLQEVDEANALANAALTKKRDEDLAKKQIEFDKEVLAIKTKIRIEGIKDQGEKELAALEVGYKDKLAQAAERYKDDSKKLLEIQLVIDEEFQLQKAAIQQKQFDEKKKKEFEKRDKGLSSVIGDADNTDFDQKKAAVDFDLALNQSALDSKLIQEDDFNKKKKELADARKKIDNEEYDYKSKQLKETGLLLENVGTIIGKQTAVGKATSAASALINTYLGVTQALRTPSTLPSPLDVIAKIANVAVVLKTGLNAVKAIYSVPVPSGGGASASPSLAGISAPAPLSPTATTTRLDAASLNGIGNAVGSSRAYVLDSDVNNNRERNIRLNRAARLGG